MSYQYTFPKFIKLFIQKTNKVSIQAIFFHFFPIYTLQGPVKVEVEIEIAKQLTYEAAVLKF